MMRGGGVSIDMNSEAYFIDCVFDKNACESKGGAVYNDFGGNPMFYNCLFIDNESPTAAAVGNDGESNSKFSNCTFYGNEASVVGPALYQGTGPYNDPILMDSIIWGNISVGDTPSIYDWNESNTAVSNSIIEGGFNGENVLDTNPLFNDAEAGDFSLQSDSPALTLGADGNSIGYNAAEIESRTEEEILSILANLSSIENTAHPTPINLTNPVQDATIENNTIYVTLDGNGMGTSWLDATNDLQGAIDNANAHYVMTNEVVSIWVASGTYHSGDSRSDSFILREGVNVYGGFSGEETSLDSRDYTLNETILSGDIGEKDELSDNSYHVVIGSDNALIDGFTITGGNADGVNGEVYDQKGGGLLNYSAGIRMPPHTLPLLGFDTIIKNTIFIDNHAIEGGAVYTYHGGNPEFENVSFLENTADYGGAVLERAGCDSTYINSSFEDNSSTYKGGAVFVDYGSMANFSGCIFDNNTSLNGGAIYSTDRASQEIQNTTSIHLVDPTWSFPEDIFSTVLVSNSTFSNNYAEMSGSAIFLYDSSNGKIVNSEFANNISGDDIEIAVEGNSELFE